MAVLYSWVGFLLYLQRCAQFDFVSLFQHRVCFVFLSQSNPPSSCRFEGVGIYVVMFGEIMKTLVRIVMLFLYLMLAFSLAFYALMLNHVRENVSNAKELDECSIVLRSVH